MFLLIVSGIIFLFTSLVLFAVVLDCMIGFTLARRVYGAKIYMTSKTLVFLLFWIASGAYLFQ